MGSLYRSEEMSKVQLFLQTEAAYASVAELGELGLLEFRDLNADVNNFQRKFVSEIRRCDEMERKLRFFAKEIGEEGLGMPETEPNPEAPRPREMIDLEATFDQLEGELKEINGNAEKLSRSFLELSELRHILAKTQALFEEGEEAEALEALAPTEEDEEKAVTAAEPHQSDLNFVAGVILRSKEAVFERLLWRACRGNVFMKKEEINEPLFDPVTNEPVSKSVFVIFFQGAQLKERVKKICDAFKATLYPCPSNPPERREMIVGVMARLEDLKTVMNQTQDHRRRDLQKMARQMVTWVTKVRKMKAIYHTLNMLSVDVTQKCLIAEAWAPSRDLDKVHLALKRGTDESGSTVPSILNVVPTDEEPPTYHRTNKFTKGFQNIVDAYGIASYRECNPAPYTIISFPFLFAIMFGDAGHGMIMLMAALAFIIFERKLISMKIKDEIFSTFFGGRYIIMMMGLFSMYTGTIYNEYYSRSINVLGTSWLVSTTDQTTMSFANENVTGNSHKLTLDPKYSFQNYSYAWGMDPIWNLAANKLNFQDSFKMKMSVIIGIAQMAFGVCLSLANYIHFRSKLDIFGVFVPQILFLGAIFMYLCIEIISKWLTFSVWPGMVSVGYYPGPHCAPGLLIGLISMFMFNRPSDIHSEGFVVDSGCAAQPSTCKELSQCSLRAWYHGQFGMETFLVLLAVACIPWMLLTKPLILRRRHKAAAGDVPVVVRAEIPSENVSVESLPGKSSRASSTPGHSRNSSKVNGKPAPDAASVNSSSASSSHSPASTANQTQDHGGHGGHGEEFEFSEVMIHQIIHTIEFCLGCISHTASYLRLWALSLAHSELSEVLWNMILQAGFTLLPGYGGSVALYVVFWAFSSLTIAVLILMEGLSAFLHALRLHWVEFQSKFYAGAGVAFQPFSFHTLMDEEF